MTYTTEQFEKQKKYVEQQMEGYTWEQKNCIISELRYKWPTDDELKKVVSEKKAEFDNQVKADDKQIDDIMEYL